MTVSSRASFAPGLLRPALALLLVAMTVAVFGQVVGFEFLTWDDPEYVVLNEPVRQGLTLDGLRWALTTTHAGNWHPLTWLSHMIDFEIHGDRPGGHHLTNLILHLCNVLLLFRLLDRLTGRVGAAALAAGLFAVHPMQVEAVAWVSERKELLSTAFGLCALHGWAAYGRLQSRRHYLLCALAMTASLLAKPTLVTLPLLLLLLDLWPLERLSRGVRRLLLEKLPLLAISIAASVTALVAQQAAGAMRPGEAVAFPARLANALVSYQRYIEKLIWPRDLTALYPHPELPGGTALVAWQVAGALTLLIGISLLVVRFRRRPYLAVGWFWFLVALIPMLGLVQVGEQGMADRYLYIPSIGLFVLVAFGGADLFSRRAAHRTTAGLAAVGALGLLGWSAHAEASHWHDSLSLYRHSIASEPGSPTMQVNLGVELRRAGRPDEAIERYREALRLDPGRADAHNNLANVLRGRGEAEAAVVHYLRAVERDPGYAEARFNLAATLESLGRGAEAVEHYEKAIDEAQTTRPRNDSLILSARLRLAAWQAANGRFAAAIEHYRGALEIDANNAAVHNALGQNLAASGHLDLALESFAEAARLSPDDPGPLNGMARILATHRDAALRDPGRAVSLAERAVRLANEPDARFLDTLAAAYAAAGRFDEAVRVETAAIEFARRGAGDHLVPQFRARLALYTAGRPYRDESDTAR